MILPEIKTNPSTYFSCGYEFGEIACLTCPTVSNCPKHGKITAELEKVARTFIKPCKKQRKGEWSE